MSEDDFFPPEETIRRFPVYLLLDCSGTMIGEPITAVTEGLEMIHQELLADEEARQRVHISVITFAEEAIMEHPLVPIDDFVSPTLEAGGKTAMGAAFQALLESIEMDLFVNGPERKGDYRPLVFLLTDGKPSDSYQDILNRLKTVRNSPTIVALGCGPEVDKTMLHEVTSEHVYLMTEANPELLKRFFKWVTSTIISKSHVVGSTGKMTDIEPLEFEPGIVHSVVETE